MVLIGASYFGVLRARDGVNFDALGVLASKFAFTVSISPNACFMSFGPGKNPTVPGTRLYWASFTSDIQYTDGSIVAVVPGSPVTADGFNFLYYDREGDILYVTYDEFLLTCKVASFNGAAWDLTYADPGARGGTSAIITVVPRTSALRPGRPMTAADDLGDSVQTVKSYDGAAWVTELTQHVSDIPMFLVPWGDQVVFGSWADRGAPTNVDKLVQLRAADGTWTDITPAQWQPPTMNVRRQAICACVAEDVLYVAFRRVDLTKVEIWKRTAAGVWSLELDLIAEGTTPAGRPWSLSYIGGVIRMGMNGAFAGNYYLAKDILGGGGWIRHPLVAGLQPAFSPTDTTIQFFLESLEGTITPDHGNCSGEYGDLITIHGFWDGQAFVAWGVGGGPGTWSQHDGLWTPPFGVVFGTQVFMGNGVQQFVHHSQDAGDWVMGDIDVLDPFVLQGRPPNGRGFVPVQVDNLLSPGHLLLGDANYPLFLPDGYEFVCPSVDSIDPPNGSINGGYIATLRGQNFFRNLINPTNPFNRVRVVNRIWVRTAAGKFVEVDSRLITFVDEETITFPMASYPGGTDPNVEVLLHPAGLAPFSFGFPVGIIPYYACPTVRVNFSYTGLDFAVLGSLETLLGLGGTGGDVAVPSGGPGGGPRRCPPDVTAGPCAR